MVMVGDQHTSIKTHRLLVLLVTTIYIYIYELPLLLNSIPASNTEHVLFSLVISHAALVCFFFFFSWQDE